MSWMAASPPVREGGQRGLACPLGGHLRGRRAGGRTQGGGQGFQARVVGDSEKWGRRERKGAFSHWEWGSWEHRASSCRQPRSGQGAGGRGQWGEPLRGRKAAPWLYQGSLWHLTHPLLPPVGAAYRMEGRKRPKPSSWGSGEWLVFLTDKSKHLWGRVGTKSPLEEIPSCISGQDMGLGRTQESVFKKSPV